MFRGGDGRSGSPAGIPFQTDPTPMQIKLTPAQAAKLGIRPAAAPAPGSHEGIVAAYSDQMIQLVIDDLGARNLRDQRDHEVRWCAERCSAARHERQARKLAGKWTIQKEVAR